MICSARPGSRPMNFDLVASFYLPLERLFAGQRMQECRTAFLSQISAPRRVLLCGEGTGSFLLELRNRFPHTHITLVDSSACMLATVRKRLELRGIGIDGIEFIHGDLLNWQVPQATYDLVVTCFFLDCFTPQEQQLLIPRLAQAATREAHWLLADFQVAGNRWRRWRSLATLKLLYLFFKTVSGVRATRLSDPAPLLQQAGFSLRQKKSSDRERMCSEWWCRGSGN